MLTVYIPAASQSYIQIGVAAGTLSQGTHPYLSWAIRPFYGPFAPNRYPGDREIARYMEGRIIDYPGKDAIGDKSVLHHNIDGEINLVPFSSTVDPPSVGYVNLIPVKSVICASSTIRYTHLAPVGTDLYQSYSYDYVSSPPVTNQARGTLYIRVWHLEDGRCGYGWFTDRESWDGRKFVHLMSGSLMRSSFENTYLSYKTASSVSVTSLSAFNSYVPTRGTSTNSATSSKRYWPNNAYIWTEDDARLWGMEYILDEEHFPPLRMPPDPNTLGDLSQRCINQQEYVNVNTLGFVNELRNISLLLPKIGKWKSPKTWGSLYLWWKYGITLTLSDSKNLLEAISVTRAVQEYPDPVTSVFASDSRTETTDGATYVEESHYKLSYTLWPSAIMEFIRKGRNWNLWPKLATAWDMIPLSFVVDWAVDVQSLLSRLDTYTDVQYYDIVACCWSRKVVVSLPAASVFQIDAMEGDIKFTYYRRSLGPRPHLPKLRFDETGQFKNYAELASLIVTR